MGRLTLLAATMLVAAATSAHAQRTRLTVYTALENEQLAPFKAAAEKAIPDVEIAWVRDSTGVITARLLAEKANPRADVIWGLSVFSIKQLEDQGMLVGYTPPGGMRSGRSSVTRPSRWAGLAWTPSPRRFASTRCWRSS